MNIQIKKMPLTLQNLIELKRLSQNKLNFFCDEKSRDIKDNIEILYLFEFLDEKKLNLLDQIEKSEYLFESLKSVAVKELLELGCLTETIQYFIDREFNASEEEIKAKNHQNIINLEEEEYLEYCFSLIIEHNIDIQNGRRMCLLHKNDLQWISDLNEYLMNDEE